jgi:1-acyl-sn-glycerol-3-phosphate acyltransferase
MNLVSWLFTVPFLVVFGLVFVFYDPLLRLARALGPRPEERVAGLLQWSAMQALRVTGTRFAIERAPGLRARTAYIFMANHQSIFDIALLGGVMLTSYPKYVAKKELARGLPSVSFHLREGGNAIIDRNNREQAIAAIRDLGRRGEERGVSVVIYPEGTRAREGLLKPFKLPGSLALLEAAPHLPVVPVAIDESWKLVRHRFLPVPFGTRVRFHLGEPILRGPGEDREALVRRAEDEIRATLERWRAGG